MNTRHAATRARQRGIQTEVEDVLDRYGCEFYDGHGACLILINKKAKREVTRAFGADVRYLKDGWTRAYKVVDASSGEAITIGHRYRHIRRK